MNKSLLAGAAMIAGIAIAAPVLAWSADDEPQMAQAGAGGGGQGGLMDRMMGEHGMMEGHHGMMGGMMGHHGWIDRITRQSPQQRCEERIARRAGMVAYVVTKLNLTAEQRPLWDKLQQTMQANADRERQLCAGLKPRDERGSETLLDRMRRQEQFLTAKLQGLQQARPQVEQLYQALTPEQKAIADHPFQR